MSETSIKIALVGSSGGGSATLSSSESIIENIQKNVHKIVARRLNLQERSNKQKTSVSVPLVSITEVAFVQSKSGLDFIGDDQANDSVKLWVMESGGLIVGKCVGSLDHVNIALMIEDARIARLIHSNTIHAVITISSDPIGANKLTISAAIKKNIPIIGTGGTSLSCISTLGGNVIGCSGGSVATTGVTRGICIAASLASYLPWGSLDYSLPQEPTLPKFRSVVGAALPLLLSVSLLKVVLSSYRILLEYLITLFGEFLFNPLVDKMMRRHTILSQPFMYLGRSLLVKIPNTSLTVGEFLEDSTSRWYTDIFYSLEQRVIPVVISAISCMEVCQLEELSLLTGAAAGALISGSIIGAYISGTLCGFLLPWFLIKCSKLSLLPTSTTIISVGASAMISGLLASILCSTIELISLILSNKFYEIMSLLALYLFGSVSSGFHLFGGILGWGISWGSEEGYYHLILLPLIALSMKSGNFSLFGTLDMLCLCLPCAGVCSAVYILSVLAAKKEMNERLNHTRTTVNSDTRKKNDDSREKSGTPIDGTSHDDSVSALSGINCVRVSSMQTRSSASKRRESAIEKPDTDTISLTASQNVEKMSIGTEVDKKYSCRRGNSPNAEFLGIDNKKVAVSSTSLGVDQGTREDSKEKGIASTDDSSVKQTETDNRNYQHHINLGRRGTISNLLMGDFVEACYPYSQGNRWVLLSVRVASSVAGSLLIGYLGMDVKAIDCVRTDSNNDFSILLSDSVKATVGSCVNGPFRSSAYLPLPLTILLVYLGSIVPKSSLTSTYPSELTVLLCSALIAYILPFFVTLIVYRNMEKIDLKP